MMFDLSDQTIAHNYKLEKKVGSGAMGEIYLARDIRLERPVAIKIIKPGSLEECPGVIIDEILERFRREAKAIAKLSHPNIVNIFDIGNENGVDYLVMEYIDGQNLAGLKGKLTIDKIIDISVQLCDALNYVHKKNIIHRDIKPSNIMLTNDGQAKLMDFGLAQLNKEGFTKLTQEGSILGSLYYISPEQLANSAKVNSCSDIYSLGASIYELLTGIPPFNAGSIPELVAIIMREKHLPAANINQQIPDLLDKIIDKALEKNPVNRYQDAKEMEIELQSLLNNPFGSKFEKNNSFIDKLENLENAEKTFIMSSKIFKKTEKSGSITEINKIKKIEAEIISENEKFLFQEKYLENQKNELKKIIDERKKLELIEEDIRKEHELLLNQKEIIKKQHNFKSPEIINSKVNHLTQELHNRDILFDQAKHYLETGDYDVAIGCLRTLIDNNPKMAEYHSYLGIVLNKKGYEGYAQSEFKVALHFNPTDPIALKNYIVTVNDEKKVNNGTIISRIKNIFNF